MPVMDGLTLIHHLKENPPAGNPKVLVVTSGASVAKIEELHQAGADAVLSKPLKPARFTEIMDLLLKREAA